MSYVDPDYKSKKAFREAVKGGAVLATYNPSGLWPVTQDGTDVVEGPHYPKPHRWYATVVVANGVVVKVTS